MSKSIRLNDLILNCLEEYRQDLIMKNESADFPSKEKVLLMLENMTEQDLILSALLYALNY